MVHISDPWRFGLGGEGGGERGWGGGGEWGGEWGGGGGSLTYWCQASVKASLLPVGINHTP